jgi:hypothetical protein
LEILFAALGFVTPLSVEFIGGLLFPSSAGVYTGSLLVCRRFGGGGRFGVLNESLAGSLFYLTPAFYAF